MDAHHGCMHRPWAYVLLSHTCMSPADELDSITPYLSLAITAVSLIDGQQQTSISPSRLLAASAALRGTLPEPSAPVYSIAQACLHPLLVSVPRCLFESQLDDIFQGFSAIVRPGSQSM